MAPQVCRGVHAGQIQLEELSKRGSSVGRKTALSVFTTVAENLEVLFFFITTFSDWWSFPGGISGKEPACHCRRYKR